MASARSGPQVAPEEDVLRHFSGGRIDKGVPLVGSLELPPYDQGEMSVDRPLVFSSDIEVALVRIRQIASEHRSGALRKNARFVRWNVGDLVAITAGSDRVPDLNVWEDPLAEEADKCANPAHAIVSPIPYDTTVTDEILDLLRPHIKGIYPAIAA